MSDALKVYTELRTPDVRSSIVSTTDYMHTPSVELFYYAKAPVQHYNAVIPRQHLFM